MRCRTVLPDSAAVQRGINAQPALEPDQTTGDSRDAKG